MIRKAEIQSLQSDVATLIRRWSDVLNAYTESDDRKTAARRAMENAVNAVFDKHGYATVIGWADRIEVQA